MTAPILDSSASPALPTILQGAADPVGITIAELVIDGSITDPDGEAVEAVAITGLNTGLGAWQYSLDSGATWLTIQADLINSTTNELALLLGPTAMIRLLPFGELDGSLGDAVTFRAWDQSTGSTGAYAVLAETGGDTAFSTDSDTASISVEQGNHAPSFHGTGPGYVLPQFAGWTYALGSALLPDGGIVMAGSVQPWPTTDGWLAGARFDRWGQLDPGFNGTGVVLENLHPRPAGHSFGIEDFAQDVLVQADGKVILVGGSHNGPFALVRYDTDGSLDESFNSTGIATAGAADEPALFEGNVQGARAGSLQPDGKIVVVGSSSDGVSHNFTVLRYNGDGSLDTTFNGTGCQLVDFGTNSGDHAFAVAVLPDGKLLIAGTSAAGAPTDFDRFAGDTQIAVARLNPDGSLDTSFNGTGMLLDDFSAKGTDTRTALAVQTDGKFLVTGHTSAGYPGDFFTVARYNADGSPDTSFNGTGTVTTSFGSGIYVRVEDILVQPDGKVVVAGHAQTTATWQVAIARYNPDGSLDTTFNGTGKLLYSPAGYSVAADIFLQPDGKLVVAGSGYLGTMGLLARFNLDGTLDTTFGASSTLDGTFTYTENAAPIALDSSVSISDPDLAALNGGLGNYAGASISLSRDGGADTQDLFSARSALSFSGGNAVLSGVTIGTVSNSGGHLIITFNSNATQARVNEALSSIGYANSSHTPPASVVINYVFSDGNAGAQGAGGAFGVTGSVTVNIAEVNDAPSGNVTISGVPSWGMTLTASNTLADADGLGTIGYQWLADGSPIVGGTGNALLIAPELAGKAISVTASYVDLMGNSQSITSASTTPVPATPGATGTAGPDTLSGTGYGDMLSGLAGNDTLNGVAGDDTLVGGVGTDSLNGGEGSDLYMIAVASEHAAAEFADSGTSGTDEVRFAATSGTLTIFAGDTGIDRVAIGTGTGASAITTATTSLGINASAAGNALLLIGNAGANALTGTAFNDTLDGGAGADQMAGGNGNDTYVIDNARDTATERSATGGTDSVQSSVSYALLANVENLVLQGSAAINGIGNALSNVITGNGASNVLDGKAGLDSLDGGEGSDIYAVGLATDHTGAEFADSGTGGTDEVRFTATKASTLTLVAGDTGIEQVVIGTGTGVSAVTAGKAALNVNASAVANGLSITGNAGANILTGTAFGDTLSGGSGLDTLTGGAGADNFVFSTPGATSNRDTITDFTSGTDALQFSKAVFAAIAGSVGTLSADQFWSSASATSGHDADDRIIYNTTTGVLYYDADGSGGGAAVQVALIGTTTHPAVVHTDIQLIA